MTKGIGLIIMIICIIILIPIVKWYMNRPSEYSTYIAQWEDESKGEGLAILAGLLIGIILLILFSGFIFPERKIPWW